MFLFLLSFPFCVSAQQMEWEEAPQYEIGIGGKPDYTTRVFQPMSNKPLLIILPQTSNSALMMELSTKKIIEIAKSSLKMMTEFISTSNGLPTGREIGRYAVKGGVTTFSYAGSAYSIRIKESLVGDVSEAMLLAHSPVYGILRDSYKPKKGPMSFLKSYKTKTELVIMFATWCPTCKRVIPHLLRVLKDAANRNFSTRFIGIAMGGSEPRAELEQFGHEYPDIILFQNGKEKGRITGEPSNTLEDMFVSILKK